MSDLKELRDLIRRSPSSHEKINLVEEAIRLADSLGDLEEAFDLRDDLISLCTEYGQFMKAIVAFSWCLARVEEGKFKFDYYMSWNYGAVMGRAAAFDSISLEQLNKLHSDFHRHMKTLGATDQIHYSNMLRSAIILRSPEMAKEAKKNMLLHKKDSHSDCPACLQNTLAQYEQHFGTYERMKALAEPLFQGKMSCNMIPLRTYGFLVNTLHRGGDTEMAAQASEKGIRLIGNKSGFLEQIGLHLIYLAETDMRKATGLFKKTLKWALNNTEVPWGIFHFHIGAFAMFGRGYKRKMALDAGYPLYEASGEYNSQKLAAYHLAEAEKLAGRFDKRNGHDWASRFLDTEKARI